MARAALQRRLTWLVAEAVDLIDETSRVRTIIFDVPGWEGHVPGQHVDLRLTAEDGYQAQRSYSIAAPEEGERVAITVELVDDGEVSPFLIEELRVGDHIELRGPIGGYFVWKPGNREHVQLVGGGSGIVPLMAMMRARVATPGSDRIRLLYSARSRDDIIYREELDSLAVGDNGIEVVYTLTRSQPNEWEGLTRRVDKAMLEAVGWPPNAEPVWFVCGPTGFVETVATALVGLGHPADRIKTERFGPTGGT